MQNFRMPSSKGLPCNCSSGVLKIALVNRTSMVTSRVVANTKRGSEPRVIANVHEWLQIPRGVARTTPDRIFFFKVGICIDIETWEKERYHCVSV